MVLGVDSVPASRDKLTIMAKRAVEVCECDRCGKEPANTWLITGPDGAPREIELCDHHASPIANAYALARPVAKKAPRTAPARTRGRARKGEPAPDQAPQTMQAPQSPGAPSSALDVPFVLPKPDPQPIWR